ncbi:DUF4439 domain-containing protein [Nocardioides solisilvae]|uniref:DUF4439 domain-containing protein n=1 Tax=Nocardioides solisilvae TaxID=1542435 RepID=UPI0013A52CF6|nr:DUF4439 domain-containing protein [Nocardioides solisilvae]
MSTLERLQAALAAEHAAVHVLAVVAAQAASAAPAAGQGGAFTLAAARHAVHLGRRDLLVDQLRAREAEPVAAAAAYELPELGTTTLALAAGALVEERCLAVYADLVAASSGRLRAWSVEQLQESAVAVLAWDGLPRPFPGADEL